MTQLVYQVGEHLFALDMPNGLLSEKELAPYAPFRTACRFKEDLLFSLSLLTDAASLPPVGQKTMTFEDEIGRMTLYAMPSGGMAIELFTPPNPYCCSLCISPDYRKATAWIGGNHQERHYALDTMMMLLYAFASSSRDTLLLHASVVEYNGSGYLFLGKSGTGKSTHSRLWLQHANGATLLNDDNPVVRVIDGQAYVFGSPWSGKTPCYLNRKTPVGAIVRLHQAPHNTINRLDGTKAYAALLPSCSCMKWNHPMAEAVHRTIGQVLESVAVYDMACLPNPDAATLCMKTITNDSNKT